MYNASYYIQSIHALHWLPVRQPITYKTALLMYMHKSILGLAPSYLAASCQPTSYCAGVAPAVQLSGPPTCISFTFHEKGRAMATGVSWSTVLLCGTVCRLRCIHVTGHVFRYTETFPLQNCLLMRIGGLGQFAQYKSPYF